MSRQRVSGRGVRAPFGLSSHPTDEELLASLDGELDGRALTRIRSHLDGCWGCRGRRDRLNQTIAAFVETRLEDSTRREGFPPSSASRLSARLDEVDARSTPPPLWRRTWRRTWWRVRAALAWRPTPTRFAQACVAGLTIAVVVVLSIGREPSVSAHELLARTVAAQEARLRPVAQPVVYQRLQVSRRGAAAGETRQTWELWSDTVHGRYRERVGAFAPIAHRAAPEPGSCLSPGTVSRAEPPAPIRELESILCANGLPAAMPLSARDYREWRGRVRGASDRVQMTQASDVGPALVLRTSLPDGRPERGAPMPGSVRIREAELVVRADDWHPLAQRFVVQTADDVISYELRELSFEVVALASVAPAFFEEHRETALPAVAKAPADAISEADVIAAEVQAWEALHQLGALLGEPVEIVRAPASPRVEVRGLASSPERKQAIVDAVSAIPLVTVDVRTVAEALAAKSTRGAALPSSSSHATTSSAPEEPAMVQTGTGTVPIQPLIEAAGGSQAVATEIVSLSRDAMSQAWALERLARFAQRLDASAVPPSSRRTLERIASELAASTAAKLDALREHVLPITAPVLDTAPPAASASPTSPTSSAVEVAASREWETPALRVFAHVKDADEMTRQLFTESNAGLVELGPSARALIDACIAGREQALTLTHRLTPHQQR